MQNKTTIQPTDGTVNIGQMIIKNKGFTSLTHIKKCVNICKSVCRVSGLNNTTSTSVLLNDGVG